MIIDEEDYLEHYGTKGMRWGVRRQRRHDRLKRVASGKGSFRDKLSTLETAVSLVEVARDRSFTKAAERKWKDQEARKKRLAAGEATTKDLLKHLGSQRFEDFIPVRKSK